MFSILFLEFLSFYNKFVVAMDSRNDDLRPFLRLTDSYGLQNTQFLIFKRQREIEKLGNWGKTNWESLGVTP